MSLAEEMLATMPLSDDSSTLLADEEGHIVINESRQAIVPNELKTIAVTGDKDIETVTFDCVRYWDGYDLSTFAIYLNYVLPDMTTGTYIPKRITTSEGDKFYHFDWVIEKNITPKSGKISFAVTAVKTKQNENGETVVDKQWGSLPNGDCSIALGLNIENVPDNEETQNILSQMSAILEQIHADVDEWIKTALVQEVGDSEDKAMSQKATTVAIEDAKSYARSYTDEKSVKLNADIQKNYQIAIRNSKRITNIEQGIPAELFETDDTVAYRKDVPENALPFAEVGMVGGMTYKDGDTLKSAKVTVVKSVGANLWDEQWEVGQLDVNSGGLLSGTTRIRSKNYIPLDGEVEYHFSYDNNSVAFCCYDANYTFIGAKYLWYKKFTTPPNTKYVKFMLIAEYGTTYKNDIMLNKGSTNLPYTPYVEHTLPIPEAVRPANGINSKVYDSIEWGEDGKQRKCVKCGVIAFDGTEIWNKVSNLYFVLYSSYAGISPKAGIGICSHFKYSENTFFIGESGIAIFKNELSSVGEFKAYLAEQNANGTPVTIVYELAEPEVTDISDLITSDNLIGVEGNGTITFENEYGYAVPSEVTYQLKGATA